MADTLDYQSREQDSRPPPGRSPVVLAILAVVCLLLPFGLLYIGLLMYPTPAEAAWFAVLPFMGLLWLGSGLLSLGGTVLGIESLRHEKPTIWIIASTTISAVVLLIELIAVAAGFLRTLRFG